MNESSLLQLFSDEAATPSPEFIKSLESKVIGLVRPKVRVKLSARSMVLIVVSIAIILLLILAVVFLPKRDMRDATKDSVIESVVTTTQESASSFVATDTVSEPTPPRVAPTPISVPSQQNESVEQSSPPVVPPATPYTVTGFIAEFWNHDDSTNTSPSIPLSAPVYTTTVADIEFSWGLGSPSPLVDSDAFIARFTKDAVIPSGSYKVEYSNNDGLRMFVNETVVFDHWDDGVGSGIGYFSTDPSVPTTYIQIDFHESTDLASVSVTITKID